MTRNKNCEFYNHFRYIRLFKFGKHAHDIIIKCYNLEDNKNAIINDIKFVKIII